MTMTKEYNKLDKTFNLVPEVEVLDTPEGGCATRKDQLTNVTNKPPRLTQSDVEKDYEYTRGNLYSIIEKGQEAINGILEVAQDSDMPRAYEVAGQLIKSVSDATDKLMDLQKKLKDVNAEDEKKGPTTVNNALFVGATAVLAKLIKSENGTAK